MLLRQYELGAHKNFTYVLMDQHTRSACIVDPQSYLNGVLADLKSDKLELKAILLTHSHWDHIAGVPRLLKDFPDIQVHVGAQDANRLQVDPRRIKALGDTFELGNLQIQVLPTPGHSSGECCFFIPSTPPILLSGDTLFIRDCGRTDLETGSDDQMFESLQKLKRLPPDTLIYPGHHYQPESFSTLAAELATSPPLLCKTIAELRALP